MTQIDLEITNKDNSFEFDYIKTKTSQPLVIARSWLHTHHPEWETAEVNVRKPGASHYDSYTLNRHN